MKLKEIFTKNEKYFMGKFICIDNNGIIKEEDYKSFFQRALNAAFNLKEKGCKSGSRVAISVEENWDFFPLVWGTIFLGATAIPVKKPMSGNYEIEDIIKWSKMTNADFLVSDIENDYSYYNSKEVLYKINSQSEFLDEEIFLDMEVNEEFTPIAILTSGSTEEKKCIPLSIKNIYSNLYGIFELLKIGKEDVFYNWLPSDHVVALLQMHVAGIFLGANQIHSDTKRILEKPERWMMDMSNYNASVSWSPDFAYKLASDVNEKNIDECISLENVHCLINAGETVTLKSCKEFIKKWKTYGLNNNVICPSWGMTETCGIVIIGKYIYGEEIENEKGSILSSGKPINGLDVRIEYNDEGNSELLVRGDMVTKNKFNTINENNEEDGWLYTGDICKLENSEYTIVGRSKDLIIYNGLNISSVSIEQILEKYLLDQVSKILVFSSFSTEMGRNSIYIIVVPKKDTNHRYISRTILKTLISEFGFGFDEIFYMRNEDIPKTGVGKIKRNFLRKLYSEGKLVTYRENDSEHEDEFDDSDIKSSCTEKNKNIVKKIFLSALNIDEMGIKDNFFLIGGSSAQIPYLLEEIKANFGKKVSAAEFITNPTIEGINSLLGNEGDSEFDTKKNMSSDEIDFFEI